MDGHLQALPAHFSGKFADTHWLEACVDSEGGLRVLEKRGTATPSSIAVVTAGVEPAICVLFNRSMKKCGYWSSLIDSCLLIGVNQDRRFNTANTTFRHLTGCWSVSCTSNVTASLHKISMLSSQYVLYLPTRPSLIRNLIKLVTKFSKNLETFPTY